MEFYEKIRAQQENVDQGQLKVTVMTADGTRPVENARVKYPIPERADRRSRKYGLIPPDRYRFWM